MLNNNASDDEQNDYIDVFTKQSMSFLLTSILNGEEQVEAHSVDMTFVETYPIDPLPKQPSEVKPYTFMVVVPYQQIEEWGLNGVPMDRGLTFQSKNTTAYFFF